MRKGIIYVCVNMFDGKRYIGQTVQDFIMRKRDHIQDSLNKNSQLYFHRALRKFGVENFIWSVIESNIPQNELNTKEQFYIKKYKTNNPKNGYNMNEGGSSTHNSSLTLKDVNEIKNLLKKSDMSMTEISKLFSVDASTISDINCGDTHFDCDEKYPIRYSKYYHEISKQQVFDIYDLLRLGKSFKTISMMYGVTDTNISNINKGKIHRYLDDSEYPLVPKAYVFLDELTIKNIAEMLTTTNLTQQKIGEKLGVTRESVKNINLGKHNKSTLLKFGYKEFPLRVPKKEDIDFKNKIIKVANGIKNTSKSFVEISKEFSVGIGTVRNINKGISHKQILNEMGYNSFPIRKTK